MFAADAECAEENQTESMYHGVALRTVIPAEGDTRARKYKQPRVIFHPSTCCLTKLPCPAEGTWACLVARVIPCQCIAHQRGSVLKHKQCTAVKAAASKLPAHRLVRVWARTVR